MATKCNMVKFRLTNQFLNASSKTPISTCIYVKGICMGMKMYKQFLLILTLIYINNYFPRPRALEQNATCITSKLQAETCSTNTS